MATHSCILAWKIPWTKEPGGLQPMELQRQTQLTEQLKNSSAFFEENVGFLADMSSLLPPGECGTRDTCGSVLQA